MIKQNYIALDSPAEWRGALKGINHAFAHTWESCYAMHLSTGLTTNLYHFQAGDVQIVCPIAERQFGDHIDIVTPYGFSGFVGNGDCPQFPQHWKKFVRQRGYVCGYIGLNPVFENHTYFEPDELHQSNTIYVLDLTLSEEELFANLSTNRKRQLKNWRSNLTHIVLEKPVLRDFLLAHYVDFFRSKQASPVYNFTPETLSFLLGLDNVVMVGAASEGKVEAVSVFAHTAHSADYLFNVSVADGRHHAVTLLWYGVNALKALEIPLLNMGGGIRPNDGVAEFKQRFGCRELTLGSLKQIYEVQSYQALCRRVGVDDSDLTGYFPAYRTPEVKTPAAHCMAPFKVL